jgi:hypothetical protein
MTLKRRSCGGRTRPCWPCRAQPMPPAPLQQYAHYGIRRAVRPASGTWRRRRRRHCGLTGSRCAVSAAGCAPRLPALPRRHTYCQFISQPSSLAVGGPVQHREAMARSERAGPATGTLEGMAAGVAAEAERPTAGWLAAELKVVLGRFPAVPATQPSPSPSTHQEGPRAGIWAWWWRRGSLAHSEPGPGDTSATVH